jgi:hypothetical protein
LIPPSAILQESVDVAEGGEQSGVLGLPFDRFRAPRAEIARGEQIAGRDDGHTHGPVFVPALRPSQFCADPKCKTH